MARCLVTGACGFMGTHMVEVLVEGGHEVVATDLAASYEKDDPKAGRFPSVLKKHGVTFVPADVTQPGAMDDAAKGVDYIFHIAAIFNYSAPPELLHRVNVEGTRHLIEYLRKSPRFKKIILWGAGGVYRAPKSGSDLPLSETSPVEPANDYLKSKWAQECLVRETSAREGLRFSVLHPTTVYGPRGVYGGGQLIRDALAMGTLAIPKNFTFRIPTVHVRDVCRAALFLAEHPETDGGTYILNDDSRTATVDYFRLLAGLTGKKFRALPPVPLGLVKTALRFAAFFGKWRRRFFGGPPPKFERDSVKYFGVDYVYDNSKLKNAGFAFIYPEFAQGLAATLPWYLGREGGESHISH